MSDENTLQTQPAVLRAVIQITRNDTGMVEEYVITGTPIESRTDAAASLPSSMRHELQSEKQIAPDGLCDG